MNKEPRDVLRKRIRKVLARLKATYSQPSIALVHGDPLELLVATILSAQCTDQRVNMVTPALFRKYHSAADYAAADRAELEACIRQTGFFRAKANSIMKCCAMLVERHGGNVPASLDELIALPGVGRKTANVILGNAFGIAEGIVVDTHGKRLSKRLGFSGHSDPEKIERDLMTIVPHRDWIAVGNLLILHGRKICTARKPKCRECPVSTLCPSAGSFT